MISILLSFYFSYTVSVEIKSFGHSVLPKLLNLHDITIKSKFSNGWNRDLTRSISRSPYILYLKMAKKSQKDDINIAL